MSSEQAQAPGLPLIGAQIALLSCPSFRAQNTAAPLPPSAGEGHGSCLDS